MTAHPVKLENSSAFLVKRSVRTANLVRITTSLGKRNVNHARLVFLRTAGAKTKAARNAQSGSTTTKRENLSVQHVSQVHSTTTPHGTTARRALKATTSVSLVSRSASPVPRASMRWEKDSRSALNVTREVFQTNQPRCRVCSAHLVPNSLMKARPSARIATLEGLLKRRELTDVLNVMRGKFL